MNISELIVEQLRQGRAVALPGMGTLKSVLREPYHDPATSTYYPASRTVVLAEGEEDDNAMVQALAARECVSENVAQQMWRNYTDALEDKLKAAGNHTFAGLGTIALSDGKYSFTAGEDLVLDAGSEREMPLKDVKTYSHEGEADPFAQFDEDAIRAEEEAERKRIEAEEEAERQRIAAEEEAERQRKEAEAETERQRIAAEEEAERQRIAAEEEAERQRIAAEEEAERQRKEAEAEAERQRIAAEEEAERQRIAAEEEAERQRVAAEEESLQKEEANRIAALDAMPAAEPTKDKDKKKKKSRWWLILLLLLLLLLLIGGAVCYLTGMCGGREKSTVAVADIEREHLDVPAENSLTFNTDMIEYSEREMQMTSNLVCYSMAEYINEFLADRGYTGARAAMMERVRQYSDQRMTELLGDRFAVQRFIPYDDYIYKYNVPYLKYKHANRSRVTVQSELMDWNMLDGILNSMIDELGLKPDGGAPKTAAEVQQVKATERRVIEQRRQAAAESQNAPVNVNVARDSKQGFDIVAGCYLNRQTATKMTARLHELGSDAYIIEKNDLYYVSMGSAANRTSAEALYRHIKSWYDGDVVIKEW